MESPISGAGGCDGSGPGVSKIRWREGWFRYGWDRWTPGADDLDILETHLPRAHINFATLLFFCQCETFFFYASR